MAEVEWLQCLAEAADAEAALRAIDAHGACGPASADEIERLDAQDGYVALHACGRQHLLHAPLADLERRLDAVSAADCPRMTKARARRASSRERGRCKGLPACLNVLTVHRRLMVGEGNDNPQTSGPGPASRRPGKSP